MEEKELLEKNRFTEEEYKKKVKEQFRQMLEDIEMEEIRKKQERKANADIVVGKSPGIEGQLSQRRSRWTK